MDVNIFKYEALKNTWEHMLNYLKNYKKIFNKYEK